MGDERIEWLLVAGLELESLGESGFFMGGALFDHVEPAMRIYREEIFGPVLSLVRVRREHRGPTDQRARVRQRRRNLHARRRDSTRIRRGDRGRSFPAH